MCSVRHCPSAPLSSPDLVRRHAVALLAHPLCGAGASQKLVHADALFTPSPTSAPDRTPPPANPWRSRFTHGTHHLQAASRQAVSAAFRCAFAVLHAGAPPAHPTDPSGACPTRRPQTILHLLTKAVIFVENVFDYEKQLEKGHSINFVF